jgi:glycine cleavage system H protein
VRYLYSRSHFWLLEASPGCWRIGLTGFATRMLGDIVEFDFEVERGKSVHVAQIVGWIEGFKAVSDLYSVADGEFSGGNEAASGNTAIVCSDPYGEGWLYMVKGTPDPQAVDVNGYVQHLELTIDKMQEKPWKVGKMSDS